MFHSFIITGGNERNRVGEALKIRRKHIGPLPYKNDPDTLVLNEKEKIGINVIRRLRKWLQKKPYRASKKIVLIEEAENLTIPAQNAFLKILEEPPKDSIIILTAENAQLFLPTILSRCRLIRLPSPQQKKASTANVFIVSIDKKILLAREIGTNQAKAQEWIEKQKNSYRQRLGRGDLRAVRILEEIVRTEKMLKANVNPRLVVEYLLLNS